MSALSNTDIVTGFLRISKALDEGDELGFDVDLSRDHDDDEETIMNCQELESALADLSSCCSFACGGIVTLSPRDKLCILSAKHPEQATFTEFGQIHSLEFQELMVCCRRAPYGDLRTQETKVDVDVRDAFECLNENFKLMMPSGSVARATSLPGVYNKEEVSHRFNWKTRELLSGVGNVKCNHKSGSLYNITACVASSTGAGSYNVSIVWNADSKREISASCSCPMHSFCKHCDATIYRLAESSTTSPSATDKDPEFLFPIHSAIQDHMYQGNFLLQLQKLNIYNTGGHFDSHVDTPTGDPAHFVGTCVVCLPHQHTGGALKVSHSGKEIVFDFGTHSTNKSIIQFAAMYGDCAHEVQTVTSGSRIVLTYAIVRTDTGILRSQQTAMLQFRKSLINLTRSTIYEGSKIQLSQRLLSAMRDATDDDEEPLDYFGVFLSHLYTRTGLVANGLKGSDLLLFELLQNNRVPVSLVGVKVHEDYPVTDDDYGDVNNGDKNFNVALLADCADTRLPEHMHISGVPFFSPWKHEQVLLKSTSTEPTNQGNWVEAGSVERLYVKAAMIIGPVIRGEEEDDDDNEAEDEEEETDKERRKRSRKEDSSGVIDVIDLVSDDV